MTEQERDNIESGFCPGECPGYLTVNVVNGVTSCDECGHELELEDGIYQVTRKPEVHEVNVEPKLITVIPKQPLNVDGLGRPYTAHDLGERQIMRLHRKDNTTLTVTNVNSVYGTCDCCTSGDCDEDFTHFEVFEIK
ncbi:hypothetical protein [Alteromonas sp. RKMC-009]|uniref:hypothetical protein n=1 Tax=Alteromonas sp. RKMC-009 TaxID=2267264 RepID=UPI000E68C93F|nr:hypothetical protein [Alteromonas sp. RKMC-009]AYA64298.1 hypothetical protein DS731_09985 [Alteromonas sp. RKMC-009]